MGGEADGEGSIDADKLIDIIKNKFEMTIDIENLIEEIDEDGSGEIEFDEFKQLLGAGGGDDDDDGDDWTNLSSSTVAKIKDGKKEKVNSNDKTFRNSVHL